MPQNSKSGPFDALSNNDGPRVHSVRAMAVDTRCPLRKQARERFSGAVEACILFQWGPPMLRRGDDAELFNATGVLGRRMDNQRGEKEGTPYALKVDGLPRKFRISSESMLGLQGVSPSVVQMGTETKWKKKK